MILQRAMTIATVFALAAFGLTACGGGSGSTTTTTTVVTPPAIVLSGTNGDMSKYIGTWRSGCGIKISIGGGPLTSGINSFTLTSAVGNAAQGTFVSDSYASSDCSGINTRTTTAITLTYTSNVIATGVSGRTTDFTGFADKIALSVPGTPGSIANTIGSRENFTKFQITSLDYFSAIDLIYVKS